MGERVEVAVDRAGESEDGLDRVRVGARVLGEGDGTLLLRYAWGGAGTYAEH
jgi:hypothetical protein